MRWERKKPAASMTLKALCAAFVALVLCAPAGWAHTDPPGASQTATAQTLGVFSDPACTVPLTVIVAASGQRMLLLRAGQTAYLQATLQFSGLAGAASYEQGRWRLENLGDCANPGAPVIIPPDPLAAPVACISDAPVPPGSSTDDLALPGGRGLCGPLNPLPMPGIQISPCVPYITTAADDANGSILFQAVLGDPDPMSLDTAYAHIGPNDLPGVSSSVPQCVLIQRCGDGNVDPGETCDPADPQAPPNCRPEGDPEECTYCGDGNQEPSEECDDGNNVDGDGCDSTCQIEPFCGDGTVDPGETCDPQDPQAPANCRPAGDPEECTYCGDGNQEASEQCDDGNNVDGDGCSAICELEECGDGVVIPPETCDPQDPAAPANCRPVGDPEQCTYCGDGNQEASEQCDDGNNVDGDGCSAECVREVPTLGQWGAILLALVLLVLGALGAQAASWRRTV